MPGKSADTMISVEIYREELITFVVRKTGSHTLASDIVQEAYLKFIGRTSAEHIQNPRAFLYRIARNLIVDGQRHERIQDRYVTADGQVEDVASRAPSMERVIAAKQEVAILKQAVLELPPRCREVFVMRKFDQLSQAEISNHLGISRNMVEKHLRKALLHCRARLAEHK